MVLRCYVSHIPTIENNILKEAFAGKNDITKRAGENLVRETLGPFLRNCGYTIGIVDIKCNKINSTDKTFLGLVYVSLSNVHPLDMNMFTSSLEGTQDTQKTWKIHGYRISL